MVFSEHECERLLHAVKACGLSLGPYIQHPPPAVLPNVRCEPLGVQTGLRGEPRA